MIVAIRRSDGLRSIFFYAMLSFLLAVSGGVRLLSQEIPQTFSSEPPDVYVPIDSWVYPALERLHGLGYLDTAFLGIRPWTRRSIATMLAEAEGEDWIHDDLEAAELYSALSATFRELRPPIVSGTRRFRASIDEEYLRATLIGGKPLRDSYHLGQTLSNDYGRPYQAGANAIIGFAVSAQRGPFSFQTRVEYDFAPGADGYSIELAKSLSAIDRVPFATNPIQSTIPAGPIIPARNLNVIEANVSYRFLGHEISFGKSDHWLAPTQGGSFLYSNNAENIYGFQIDQAEPLSIPILSRITGPFRYVFVVGALKGHSDPNAPWYHLEKVSFKPTPNVEFGFGRATIWGGKGHAPVTLHSFLKSFFSFQNVPTAEKFSRSDPGARFGTFDFSWRLPFLNHWATLYTDALVHDDVSPIDAPRHAGIRPGLFLSELPKFPRLDLRVEGVTTDPPTSRSNGGSYLYAEVVQLQGYTNKGFIMGDASGREGKGGQFWARYHFSPRSSLETSFRTYKVAKDFIPHGVSQDAFQMRAIKSIGNNWEWSVEFQHEWWAAPIYKTGRQHDTAVTFQIKLLDLVGLHRPGQ